MNIKQELALVASIKNGNREELSKLWDEINPKLYGYLINVLKNKNLADDILQETWLKAVNKIHSFKPKGVRFSAWLFAIARNECRQYWREINKKNTVNLDEFDLDIPIDITNSLEDKILVDELLQKLSEDEQELLRLRFIGQFSFKEIAKILEISVVSARVRLHRCLKKAQGLI